MKRKHRNHTEGFSLIEVIVGIAVLGLVTVPVCASLVLSMRLNASSRALMNAQLQASTAVEMLMAEGIDDSQFTSDSDEDGNYEKTVNGAVVEITAQAEGSYYDVTVTGTDGTKTVTLQTSIRAKGGDVT